MYEYLYVLFWQEIALYGEFTIRETLVYFGWISGMTTEQVHEKLDFLIKLLLLPTPSRQVKNLRYVQVVLLNPPETVVPHCAVPQ